MVTGPTTLAALLNSLQMGFRTLAIGKRSSEVWELLGVVKTEFGKFGDTLARTKKKLAGGDPHDRPGGSAYPGHRTQPAAGGGGAAR